MLKQQKIDSLTEKYAGIVINEPNSSKIIYLVKILIGSLGLVGYMAYYKQIFEGDSDMRVWEDIYGRSVFFFLPCVAHYLVRSRNNESISFFELEPEVRWLFAIRLALMGSTYGFLALAVSTGKGITTPILVLLISLGAFRLHNKMTMQNQEAEQISPAKKIAHVLVFITTVLGVALQFSSEANEPEVFDGSTNYNKGLEFFSQ